MRTGTITGNFVLRRSAFLVLISASAAVADVPTTDALRYSGVALGPTGSPLSSPQNMTLAIWNVQSGGTPGQNQRCVTVNTPIPLDSQGRFSIPLPADCVTAVAQNADLFLELTIGGNTLPRTRVGAVPFAVQSKTTSRVVLTATTHGADGGIRTTVDGVYCGSTANTNGAFSAQGGLTGVRAAKFLCEQACMSATAHMCTGIEAVRSFELGQSVPSGWAKSGSGSVFGSNGGGPSTQSANCTGWTESTSPGPSGYLYMGGFFEVAGGTARLADNYCNSSSYPIICCD